MTTNLNPYLALDGTTREAMEFYHSILGGELDITTLGEAGVPFGDPNRIMHAQLTTPGGNLLMGSDTMEGMPHQAGDTAAVSWTGDDPVLAEHFQKLSEGGEIIVPLAEQSWGATYGQFRDKFGVVWHINIAPRA